MGGVLFDALTNHENNLNHRRRSGAPDPRAKAQTEFPVVSDSLVSYQVTHIERDDFGLRFEGTIKNISGIPLQYVRLNIVCYNHAHEILDQGGATPICYDHAFMPNEAAHFDILIPDLRKQVETFSVEAEASQRVIPLRRAHQNRTRWTPA
jgi:hypothetical protein